MKKFLRSMKLRFATIHSLFGFLWHNKMGWLIPMVAVLFAFFLIIILGQSTPLGPFIYAIF